MKTKFLRLDSSEKSKETVFTHIVCLGRVGKTDNKPKDYIHVLHLGWDKAYGDVFKCWNEDLEDFTLLFGELGDENYKKV